MNAHQVDVNRGARGLQAVAGRVKQKERTRRGLLSAARALISDGRRPTIALIADKALVSEATAYRYYADVQSLLRDALVERWAGFDSLLVELRTIPTVEARAERAAEAMARNVLQQETEIRELIALTYLSRSTDERDDGAARPAFRTVLIEAILEPISSELAVVSRRKLRLALTAVIGAEATLSLKDSTGCTDNDVIRTLSWSARQLTKAALSIVHIRESEA